MKDLAALVDMLRGKGVRVFHGELDGKPIVLELGPALIPDAPPGRAEPDPEKCRCGHGFHQHQSGLCLIGCEVEQCAEPTKEA